MKEKHARYYDENEELFKRFSQTIKDLVEGLLNDHKIPYQSIQFRVKEKESFINKCMKKTCQNPAKEIMDLAGVRVIAYNNSDVEKIEKLLKDSFKINKRDSGDKRKTLREFEVGYLSVHCVLGMRSSRTKLNEYKDFKGIVCEVQVRTLLQHAWAEISHDKYYKFQGELPEKLKRRLFLLAGTLELIDGDLESLSQAIDDYSNEVQKELKGNKFNTNIEIDSISLMAYLKSMIVKSNINIKLDETHISARVIDEIKLFGINTISDFAEIIPDDYFKQLRKSDEKASYIGICRSILLITDFQKYFKNSWKNGWHSYEKQDADLWKHYNLNIEEYLLERGIEMLEEDWSI